ncbi:MAG: hypothetical protein JSW64_13340 [Candidatus Zixiibacteriota bacterium]|nr:MAG: hypothetical protein JSW64_13340 [candidate division Zixibacteria bacterium]
MTFKLRINFLFVNFLFLVYLFLCPLKSKGNENPGNFSLKFGFPSSYSFEPLSDFWGNGVSITAGVRAPYPILANYVELWANGRYIHLDFDESSQFPIDYYYGYPAIEFSGNDVSLYYFYLQLLINLKNPSKTFIPYIGFNYGYFHRSKTVFRSNSSIMEYSEIKFRDSGAFAMPFGAKVKIKSNLFLQFELELLAADTRPSETRISEANLGVRFSL